MSRPRKKKPTKSEMEDEADNREPFDEKAFLEGRIPILGGSTEENLPPRRKFFIYH